MSKYIFQLGFKKILLKSLSMRKIELKKINPTSKISFDDELVKEEKVTPEIPKITVNGETESQHSREADKLREKTERAIKQKKEKESK